MPILNPTHEDFLLVRSPPWRGSYDPVKNEVGSLFEIWDFEADVEECKAYFGILKE